jgi:hypothetical protein
VAGHLRLGKFCDYVRWSPHRNGFSKAVCLFLNKSGLVTALAEAEVASLGSAESFLTGYSIANRRQAHQLTASSIFEILRRAFKNSADCRSNVNDIDVNDIL